MRIIIVDDEPLIVSNVMRILKQLEPQAETAGFFHPDEALEFMSQNKVDIAFLDIDMGTDNGIEFAKKCKNLCPQINVVFVTGYSNYLMDAFRLHASGYIMKPVRAADIRAELDNLRNPLSQTAKHRVRIQTFGNFEVFIDEQPLHIPRTKCRECLAYLVDRKGAFIGTTALAAILWEDRPYDKAVQNSVHKVVSDLVRLLKEKEAEEIIIKARGEIAIDTQKVDCDYFGFLNGDTAKINAFHGEYMTNYGWAEFTLGALIDTKAAY